MHKIFLWLKQFFSEPKPASPATPPPLTREERKNYGFETCKRKIQYHTRDEAWKWAIYFHKTLKTRSGVYKCKYCRKFHLSKSVPYQPSERAKYLNGQLFIGRKRKSSVLRKETRAQLRRRTMLELRREPDWNTDSESDGDETTIVE